MGEPRKVIANDNGGIVLPALTQDELNQLGDIRNEVYIGIQDVDVFVSEATGDRHVFEALRLLARRYRARRTLIDVGG